MNIQERKRDELLRGDDLLSYMASQYEGLDFKKGAQNKFHIYKEDERLGTCIWKLLDDGFGTIQWFPSQGYKDIARKRSMEKYDYTDGESDIVVLVTFFAGILSDLGI